MKTYFKNVLNIFSWKDSLDGLKFCNFSATLGYDGNYNHKHSLQINHKLEIVSRIPIS